MNIQSYMKKYAFLFLVVLFFMAFQTDKPAYQIFDKEGKKTSYKAKNIVILFNRKYIF